MEQVELYPLTPEILEHNLQVQMELTRKHPGLPLYRIARIMSDIFTPEEIAIIFDNLKDHAEE